MLRVSEIYTSYQGEGPTTGRPTVFVRFAGCNLRCPGWPCDTPHAIDPKIYTKEQVRYSDPIALSADIRKEWYPGCDICFTGGEVLLQPIEDLECLLEDLQSHTGSNFVLFTNGTFALERPFRGWFSNIILDWKLSGSGEVLTPAQHENVLHNIIRMGPDDAIKFTLANLEEDLVEATYRYNNFNKLLAQGPNVYCGVVWEMVEEKDLVAKLLEEKLPWSLNVQLHKYIWPANARRT